MSQSVVFINLGTPNDARISSVRSYLYEFLRDPRVIDVPAFVRYALLYLFILPFRPRRSAKAYASIWTDRGSPLLINSQALVDRVAEYLGPSISVKLAMRYGNPSIKSVVKELESCTDLLIIPLFPQYSSAATGSALEEIMRCISKQWNIPSVRIIHQFYDMPGFIDAIADQIRRYPLDSQSPREKLVFSYHGLPERHLDKSLCQSACDKRTPCPKVSATNAFCYRAQCYETSRLLAENLGLPQSSYCTAFQSRLGRVPWIQPYTDGLLDQLREEGIERVTIVCPSFTSDCLETIEEIGMQAREQWESLGGQSLQLVPCLNDDEAWSRSLVHMIKSHFGEVKSV